MPSDNRISATLLAADKVIVLAAIATIRTKLPWLLNLTKDERMSLPKLGDKTMAFDAKCLSYMTAHPELVPSFVNIPEMAKDRALTVDLGDIEHEILQVAEGISDTRLLAGSEIYMGDMSFYQSVRQAAQRGVVGADAIYDDLKERFPGRPRTTPPPTP